MIWLRHELWDYHDGPAYRLASKAETDRLASASPEGVLKQVFYAPSAAAAEAQYCALRGMGPYIVSPTDSEEPFTMAQLESQLHDFPEDTRLARQPALPEPVGGHPVIVAPAPVTPAPAAEVHAAEGETAPHAETPDAHAHSEAHPESHADADDTAAAAHEGAHEAVHETPADHHAPDAHPAPPEPDHAAEPSAPSTVAPAPVPTTASPAHDPVEPLVPEPAPARALSAEDALGPITLPEPGHAVRKGRRRRPNVFLGFLRLVILLIVFAAVVIGVGIATGRLDGPTLIAQARALPEQVRQQSIVRSLFPNAAP